MRFTQLYVNKVYLVYNIVVYRLLVTAVVPSLLLIYMYAKIYACITKSNGFRSQSSIRGHSSIRGQAAVGDGVTRSEDNEMRKSEGKHARMFAGVVAVFILCQIPDVIVKVVKIVNYFQGTMHNAYVKKSLISFHPFPCRI